jgi:hypothetical protein
MVTVICSRLYQKMVETTEYLSGLTGIIGGSWTETKTIYGTITKVLATILLKVIKYIIISY